MSNGEESSSCEWSFPYGARLRRAGLIRGKKALVLSIDLTRLVSWQQLPKPEQCPSQAVVIYSRRNVFTSIYNFSGFLSKGHLLPQASY